MASSIVDSRETPIVVGQSMNCHHPDLISEGSATGKVTVVDRLGGTVTVSFDPPVQMIGSREARSTIMFAGIFFEGKWRMRRDDHICWSLTVVKS